MKIFLSHASEDKTVAEAITFSLRSRGHKVFLDHDDLPPGQSYDQRIERAVKDSDIFIFLVSPSSITRGRYTLTELAFARRKWPDPHRHVLPVIAEQTPLEAVPSYLKAVTILEPLGNVTPETCAAVDDLGRDTRAYQVATWFAVTGAIGGTICSFLPVEGQSMFGFKIADRAPDCGFMIGVVLAIAVYCLTRLKLPYRLIVVPLIAALLWCVCTEVALYGQNLLSASFGNYANLSDKTLATLDEASKSTINYAVHRSDLLAWFGALAIAMGVAAAGGLVFVILLILTLSTLTGARLGRPYLWPIGVLALLSALPLSLWPILFNLWPNRIDLYHAATGPLGASSFELWSTPGFCLIFAAWGALTLAAIGHWLGREYG